MFECILVILLIIAIYFYWQYLLLFIAIFTILLVIRSIYHIKAKKEQELIRQKEYEELQEKLWQKEKEHQKIKQIQNEEIEKYWGRLCAASVVTPNLEDEKLLESYQCHDGEELLKEMLTMGEYMTLLQAVQEQNQFQQRKEELKEEVKKP